MKAQRISSKQHSTGSRRKPSDVDQFADPLTPEQDIEDNFDGSIDNGGRDPFDQTAEFFSSSEDNFDADLFDAVAPDYFTPGEKYRVPPHLTMKARPKTMNMGQWMKYLKTAIPEHKRAWEERTRAELAAAQRNEINSQLERANAANVSTPAIALQTVQENLPAVQNYIQANGMQPQSNPAAAALQASQILTQKVEDKMQTVPDPQIAYESVLQDEQEWINQQYEENGEEYPEEFLGGIIASVVAAGKALVDKINKKREEKKKPPILQGAGWQAVGATLTNALPAIEQAANDATARRAQPVSEKSTVGTVVDAVVRDQKRQALNQYMPFIIAGLIIIIIFAYRAGKK